jgi:hypothetical protein
MRVLDLTALNEGTPVRVVLDAIDAIRPTDYGDIGALILLRSGETLKVRELPEEVVRVMLLGD